MDVARQGRRTGLRLTTVVRILLLGLAYFVSAVGSVLLTRESGNVSTLWIADAIAITAILLSRRQDLVPLSGVFFVASVSANLIFGDSLTTSIAFTLANAVGIAVAVALGRRWSNLRTVFLRPDRLLMLCVAIGIIAPVCAATVGATAATLLEDAMFWRVWRTWYLADAVGSLVVLPFIAIATMVRRYGTTGLLIRRSWREFAVLLGAVVGVSSLVFFQTRVPLGFMVMPVVLLATVRTGPLGAAGATLVVGIIGSIGTSMDMGPVGMVDIAHGRRIQFFQFFLTVIFISALPVGAFLAQRDRLSARLKAREADYRSVIDSIDDVIYRTDPDGRWMFLNPASKRMGGDESNALHRSSISIVHPDDRAIMLQRLAPLFAREVSEVRQELRYIHKDGSVRWVEALTQLSVDENDNVIGSFGTLRDITVRKGLESQLQVLATTDALTGLLNRRAFIEKVDSQLASRGDTTLAMIDIDHFKQVNDTYGHAAGDAVLQAFAEICRNAVTPEAVIGRIGGEEFAVLLSGLPLPEAQAVLESLRGAIEAAAIDIGGRTIHITASIGATEVDAGPSASEFLSRADKALYEAKTAGRNRLRLAA